MSWSITLIGHPDNIVKALEAESQNLSGKSKEEFDAALPHMIGLVQQNRNIDPANQPVLSIQASGHGYESADGNQSYNNCLVTINNLGGTLV